MVPREVTKTYNEGNPEHFQFRGQVEGLLDHDAIEVTVDPGDALHGGRAGHERLCVGALER